MGLAPLLPEVAPSLVAASSLLPLQKVDSVRWVSTICKAANLNFQMEGYLSIPVRRGCTSR